MRPLTRWMAASAAVAVMMTATAAHAEESPYCRKVRARASADASLLYAPSLLGELIKAPSALQPGGKLDPTSPGAGYQVRAGFSFSPLDFYKGTRVGVVADADCEQHESTVTAQQLLLHAPELGRLAAFRDQKTYLDSQVAVCEGIAAKTSDRFAAQAATLVELEAIRSVAARIARQRAQVAGEIARLEAIGLEDYRASIPALIRDIHDRSMKFEREASHVRSLDAWKVNLTGGYVPPVYGAGSSDFFGVLQIGYNLGGPFHNSAETRYLDARDEELKKSRQELGRQLQVLADNVQAAKTQAVRELEIVDKRVAELEALRAVVGVSDASTAVTALAQLDLEQVTVKADRVFLTGLVRELSRLEIN